MSRDIQCDDTELIECHICKTALNGVSLWITAEKEPKTLCENCYKALKDE